jgi:N-acetylmuramoyl-L-alanine amidase
MEVKDNVLKGDTIKNPIWSKNISGKYTENLPDTIIIHYTAGPFKASLNTLTNPSVKASAHVLVDRDGTITQLVPFDTIAWHAGKSSYKGREGFNKYSIGIEIVNSGPLTKSGNVYRSWFGSAYNPDDVIEATHRNETTSRFWHIYTEEQIEAVTELCRLLINQYGIKSILGHEEIAPSRKTDPGPAFPLDKLRNQLLSDARSEDGAEDLAQNGRVDANVLNIRDTPKPEGAKVAMPLKKGAKVQIIDQDGEWYKVRTEIEGWVFKKFIKTE